ncbi:LamG-like jellyroll fold domain-containing protein [Streptomyces sp. NPDC005963]|uniref:LamG-like jellyroll fold domain-containing protein n=1 Tax=Streptomyces sp. NPDC005963 TaxID=3156721 RepID=UPI0033CA26F6
MSAALLMTVITGTEQAALAVGQPARGPNASADAPDQKWGSADGRSHRAAGAATDAAAKGGRDGALTAPGQLSREPAVTERRFREPARPPAMGKAEAVTAPVADAPTGFDTKTSREVSAKRAETATTFRNEDGSFTTRYYNEPVNFRRADGNWQPIDTALVPEGTPSRSAAQSWRPRSTPDDIAFADRSDAADLARIRVGDNVSLAYGVEGAARSRAVIAGSTVTYPDIRPSADLELLAGPNTVKETLVLKDRNAPAEWRFPLDLRGLSAALDAQGAVVFTDAAGKERARMPRGWMEDSKTDPRANQGAISDRVAYGLTREGGRQVLTVTLDEKWLDASDRVYPVRVDPSLLTVQATSGTYVQQPYTADYSTDTVLKAGTHDGTHKAASFLRFSGVETSLNNAWVLSANLSLYNSWSYSCTARPVTIHPITSNWAESTTTKYPGPATGASLAGKSFANGWRPAGTTNWACAPAWESIKLGSAGRKLVDDWTHGRKKNYGLAIKASSTDPRGWKEFGSDDYPSGKPSLDVTWTPYGATYRLGEFTTPVTATAEGAMQVTVTNQGQNTWPAGGNIKLRYNLFDSADNEITDNAKIRWTSLPTAVSPGESVTLSGKIAPLTPGTYTLQWTMDDVGVTRFTSVGIPGPAVNFAAINIPPQITAASPPSGVVLDSLTPTLWATGTDKDRYPGALQYQFEICETEGKNTRKNCRTGTRSANKQWAVPAGWLSWGKTYAWYPYAYDGAATSARPGPALFTTEVPQPGITSHLGGADTGDELGARTGNYTTAATDATLTTVGPELAVTRTYNSLDPRTDGAFGAGWSTRWDTRLREEPKTRSVLITVADGSQVRYGENPGGGYAGPSGSTAKLSRKVDGWVLRDRSGHTYYFGHSGFLARIVDGAGRAQNLQRLMEDGGPLTRATDAVSGRSISFTWSGDRVSSVTTSAIDATTPGLTWTYTYTGNRLTKVCPPASTTACTHYTYENGSLYRASVLDSNPASYWRLGESEGSKANSEAPSRTGLNDAVYRDVTLGSPSAVAGTTDTAATFDGTDSVLELPDNTFRTSSFLSVELWFKTTKAGGVLATLQDSEPGRKPTRFSPYLSVDAAGKLRGQFYTAEHAGNQPITSTQTVTDNQWHHAVLTSSGTSQTLYLDGAVVGSLTGTVQMRDDQYAYVGGGWGNTGWTGTTTGAHHFQGSIDEVAVYRHDLDPGTVREHYDARTTASRMTKTVLPSGRTHATVEYDPVNSRVIRTTDKDGGLWQVSAEQFSSGSAAYSDSVRASNPGGYWRLGERSGGTAHSQTGDGTDGSYHGNVDLGLAGAFADGDDTSAGFGPGNYAEIPEDVLHHSTDLAVELWFRTAKPGVLVGDQVNSIDNATTATGARTPILYVGSDNKLHGKFYSTSTNTPVRLGSTDTVTDNKWHHAVISASGTTQTLYLDGVRQGTLTGAVNHQGNKRTYVGAGFAGGTWPNSPADVSHFPGQIDEVAVYQAPLSAAAVVRHYKARNAMVGGDSVQYRGSVVGDAPVGYWRMDETSGSTARSESAGGRANGSYEQAVLDRTGIFGTGDGGAVRLAGNGSVSIPDEIIAGDTSLAAELWFRTTGSGVLLGFQNQPIGTTPTSWRPVLNIDQSGKLRGQFWLSGAAGATPIVSPAAVNDNEWHHVVLSGSGTTQQLYLDGAQIGTLSGTITNQAVGHAYLGAGYASSGWMGVPSGTYRLTGELDEAAIYDTPLTAEQVAEHFRAREYSSGSALASTVTVTDPAGKATRTSYDALRGKRPLSVTDADGGLTTYAYDTGGFPHTVTNPNGHSVITGHDASGNALSRTTCRDPNSCWTSFATYYNNPADPLDQRNDKTLTQSDARSTSSSDARFRTTHAYNTLGLPTSSTLADSRSSSATYTDGTEPATGGGTTPAGLLKTRTSAAGAVTAYGYYASGDPAQVTSPSGLITRYAYDGLGRKISETQVSDTFPTGVTTTYGYNAQSKVVRETGPGVQNELVNVTHTTKIARTFDADGAVLTQSVEDTTGADAARTTTYGYDAFGRQNLVTDPEGGTIASVHDNFGRVVSETNEVGTTFTHRFTTLGKLAETTLKNWTGDPSGTPRDLVVASHAYDPAGRLASSTDAMGATTGFTYYDDGLPATTTARQVTQADGTKRNIVLESNTYDPAGHLTHQVTGGGRTTAVHTIDATGRTTRTVVDPAGVNRIATFAYNADDLVTETTRSIDTAGKKLTTTTEYDLAGNPLRTSLTDGTGSPRVTTATYDDRGLRLTSVSPRGNVTGADATAFTTTQRHDALGRLVETKAPPVQTEEVGGTAESVRPTTLTGYNNAGEPTHVRNARGKLTRTEYDKTGRPTAVHLPGYAPPGGSLINAVSRTEYDKAGQVKASVDPLGRRTSFDYDQFGQLLTKTDPLTATPLAGPGLRAPDPLNSAQVNLAGAGVTRHTWTPTGLQLSVTDPIGARTEATYDELGRQVSTTAVERHPTLQNLVTRYVWDDASHQTASTTPGGHTTNVQYNAVGEAKAVTDPLGGITRTAYDGLGRPIETTDATGRRSTTSYDALGNQTAGSDFGTGVTAHRTVSAEYDADGHKTAATSATGSRTEYTVDALGRVTRMVEPVTATSTITTTSGYNALGSRTRLTDGRGNSTSYTFTAWELPDSTIEPATTAHPNAADRTWQIAYDAAGQSVADLLPGGVRRDRTYNALGKLTGETGTGGEAATTARKLEYDLAGRMTAAGTDATTGRNVYTYNDRGQLLTATGPSGSSAYAYNGDGLMTSRDAGGKQATFGYDAAGRLDHTWDSITGGQVWHDFDAAGRPLIEQYATNLGGVEGWTSQARRKYSYDDLGRLTGDRVSNSAETVEKASTTYGYDHDDRVTQKTTAGTAGAAGNAYAYDRSGRMTSWTKGTTTTAYEWDAAGNRTKEGTATATYDARNRLLTDGTSSYAYSPRGTLSSVTATGSPARNLTFDAFERKISDGSASFAYDSLDRVRGHGSTSFSYDGGSNNLMSDGTNHFTRQPGGGLQAMETGTTKRWSVTDQHTDLVAGLSPDGLTVTNSTSYSPFGEVTASSGTGSSLGYQSGWTDPASGDVNMASRWYQPGTGSFASRDTWLLDPTKEQINRYTYAGGSPLNGTDPSGHALFIPILLGLSGGGKSLAAATGITLGLGYGAVKADEAYQNYKENSYEPSSSSDVTYPLSGALGTSAVASLVQAQVDALRKGASSSSSSSKAAGRGGSGNGGTVSQPRVFTRPGTGSGIAQSARTAVRPPRPVIDQNPNNGRNPIPAPVRPVPRPDWNPKGGGWKPGDGLKMIVGALEMLDLVDGLDFDPTRVPQEHAAPGADPGSGQGRNDDERERNCLRDGDGWVDYESTDPANGSRAVGVTACVNTAYITAKPGSDTDTRKVAPPGYQWARANSYYLGNKPPKHWVNACHLLASALGGSGQDLRNLSTCSRAANANRVAAEDPGMPENMRHVEKRVGDAVAEGQTVLYRVVPHYVGARTVPVRYEMMAQGTTPDGRRGIREHVSIPNSTYSVRFGHWRNLGTVVHQGVPVPVGATP